jgi:hypothetical protein
MPADRVMGPPIAAELSSAIKHGERMYSAFYALSNWRVEQALPKLEDEQWLACRLQAIKYQPHQRVLHVLVQ